MTWKSATFLPIVLFLTGCFQASKPDESSVQDLDLIAVYPLSTNRSLEPSGLVYADGSLFAVADKVDDTIYRIEIDSETPRIVPHLQFEIPSRYHFLDWEGITADEAGNFYLVSEGYGRILKVLPDSSVQWVSGDLRTDGSELGLFAKNNAGFEGITLLGKNHWLCAVEREPRGFIEVAMEERVVLPSLQMESPFLDALPILRIPDYSGLDTDNGQVFALFRNAHLVVQMERNNSQWSESKAWSFRHIETDPRWAYISQTFGQAEGLVVHDRDVFIVLDNNRGGRQADPGDTRPILIHARFPLQQ